MESQLHRPVGHPYDQDPHNAGLHSVVQDEGEQHHHEKKSVLKKVKDKAKQIKDKLTKDGHGHEQEPEIAYAHGDHDEYEEAEEEDKEEEDSEMVVDPEVHGAPMYESVDVRSSIPAQAQAVNLEKPTEAGEDRYGDDPRRADRLEKEEENVGHSRERPKIGAPGGLREDPHAPKSDPSKIPPPNYESKVADPSGEGGREVDVTPIISSLDKMVVSEGKSGSESAQRTYSGSHDQFAPQSSPTGGEFAPKASNSDAAKSGYVEKISVATSMIADKAISAKNAVASKLGYGGTEGDRGPTEKSEVAAAKSGASASPREYVPKVASTVTEKLAPVYGKVAGAGNAVVSKVKGGGTGDGGADTETSGGAAPDKGVSMKEYLAEKLKPGEEDKALSEVISEYTLQKKKGDSVKSDESDPDPGPGPAGKVTESEEVRRHLGSGIENKREGDDAIAAGKESSRSGGGVVDKLKGAVSSWIGKGGEQESQSPKGSAASAFVNNRASSGAGEYEEKPNVSSEQRLQESGN